METQRLVRAFICYRRDDATAAGRWLHSLMHGHTYPDRGGTPCKLDVYFDQAEPGVADWKAHHEPSLQSADALIVVCSHGLATDFSKDGGVDWAHKEMGWWLDNRSAPPIVVDLTGHERWVPERIRKRYPDLNRLLLPPDDLRDNAPDSGNAFAARIRSRIVNSIAESEHATTFDELAGTRRKNKILALSTAVAGIACVAALVGWWRAGHAEETARTQREVSRETVSFLTSLFAGADPDSYYGESLTVRRLLEVARPTIRPDASPILKANILRAVGSAYTGLGDADGALTSLKEAETLLREAKIEGEERFRVEASLGEAYLYGSEEDFPKALGHLGNAQNLAGSDGVEKHERATVSSLLGDYHAWSVPPDRENAQRFYDAALALDRADPADPLAEARDLNRLGKLALDSQQRSDVRKYYQGAVDALKKAENSPALFRMQYEHDLAAALYEDGVFEGVLAQYLAASDFFKDAYGETSLEHGIAENNAARILLELDRLDEATIRATRAVDIETAAKGADFSELAFALNNRALTMRAAGQSAEAQGEFQKAAALAEANEMGIGAQSRVHIAEFQLSRNDLAAAGASLESAKEQFIAHGNAQGWRFALYESAQGELHLRKCELDDAATLLTRSREALAARWPKGNLFTRMADARNEKLGQAPRASCTGRG